MKILVINCGSSTLKFELLNASGRGGSSEGADRVAWGIVDGIGRQSRISIEAGGDAWPESQFVSDHGIAARIVLDRLRQHALLDDGDSPAVGHRVIHGGDRFAEPTLIGDEVIAAIDELKELAPLHNGPALQAIRVVREVLGPGVPAVAVFDTAFHQTLPEHAWRYAIDQGMADKHRVRRYGFHGLAHRYMMDRFCLLAHKPASNLKLITFQLGNGCSAAAVLNGKSVDTSMGFTPLEGLVMGTRSGDVDPSLAGFLAEKEKVDINTAEDWLNTRSGLLGVSGLSGDMRELLAAERKGDRRAGLAIEMFCYRAKKYLGAYLGVLGGADGVVFGGGIGENAPEIRSRICEGMEWCGIVLDHSRNASTAPAAREISSNSSAVKVWVIPVDEASVIAREVVACLKKAGKGG